MILTVHDELLFEVPDEEGDEAMAIVRAGMEKAVDLTVPLTVDVGIARTGARQKSKPGVTCRMPRREMASFGATWRLVCGPKTCDTASLSGYGAAH